MEMSNISFNSLMQTLKRRVLSPSPRHCLTPFSYLPIVENRRLSFYTMNLEFEYMCLTTL